jgi:hypothetical protein
VAITNEEADVLLQFDEDTPVVAKGDLNDRQQMMANQLVNKNLLLRIKENEYVAIKQTINHDLSIL